MSFKYLTEHPLNSVESLDFGHQEIVSTIKKIVAAQNGNITLGLFGNWGTGKSTIVESLQAKLKPEKVPVIIFDVWKHDGDALRRTFLKECVSQLTSEFYGSAYLDDSVLLDQRVVSGRTSSEDKFSIKWRKLWNSLWSVRWFSLVFRLLP
ncbi:MAG TPA: P-loop NTPase fold protein [Pedobacter sp.]|nr:P-loop NTPase fold protein [Pedobacter sp.]